MWGLAIPAKQMLQPSTLAVAPQKKMHMPCERILQGMSRAECLILAQGRQYEPHNLAVKPQILAKRIHEGRTEHKIKILSGTFPLKVKGLLMLQQESGQNRASLEPTSVAEFRREDPSFEDTGAGSREVEVFALDLVLVFLRDMLRGLDDQEQQMGKRKAGPRSHLPRRSRLCRASLKPVRPSHAPHRPRCVLPSLQPPASPGFSRAHLGVGIDVGSPRARSSPYPNYPTRRAFPWTRSPHPGAPQYCVDRRARLTLQPANPERARTISNGTGESMAEETGPAPRGPAKIITAAKVDSPATDHRGSKAEVENAPLDVLNGGGYNRGGRWLEQSAARDVSEYEFTLKRTCGVKVQFKSEVKKETREDSKRHTSKMRIQGLGGPNYYTELRRSSRIRAASCIQNNSKPSRHERAVWGFNEHLQISSCGHTNGLRLACPIDAGDKPAKGSELEGRARASEYTAWARRSVVQPCGAKERGKRCSARARGRVGRRFGSGAREDAWGAVAGSASPVERRIKAEVRSFGGKDVRRKGNPTVMVSASVGEAAAGGADAHIDGVLGWWARGARRRREPGKDHPTSKTSRIHHARLIRAAVNGAVSLWKCPFWVFFDSTKAGFVVPAMNKACLCAVKEHPEGAFPPAPNMCVTHVGVNLLVAAPSVSSVVASLSRDGRGGKDLQEMGEIGSGGMGEWGEREYAVVRQFMIRRGRRSRCHASKKVPLTAALAWRIRREMKSSVIYRAPRIQRRKTGGARRESDDSLKSFQGQMGSMRPYARGHGWCAEMYLFVAVPFEQSRAREPGKRGQRQGEKAQRSVTQYFKAPMHLCAETAKKRRGGSVQEAPAELGYRQSPVRFLSCVLMSRGGAASAREFLDFCGFRNPKFGSLTSRESHIRAGAACGYLACQGLSALIIGSLFVAPGDPRSPGEADPDFKQVIFMSYSLRRCSTTARKATSHRNIREASPEPLQARYLRTESALPKF
ncbi:hypothetical protein FB451DRAFT_1476441 [Mycena latifolia]|nr:hypothetical protein FB451DRAFT_1476441 [Mycena latifolia]